MKEYDYPLIIAFYHVAELLNFNRAGEKLNLTQSAISQRIVSLEKRLSRRLFDRVRGKTIKLTREGEIFYKMIRPIIEDYGSLHRRFTSIINDPKRTIKIAAFGSVSTFLLPKVVKEFIKKYPETKLNILSDTPKNIVSMVEENKVDIGIVSSQERLSESLQYEFLAKYPRILIAPKNHPLSKIKESKLTIKKIMEYPFISPPVGSNTEKYLKENLEQYPLDNCLDIQKREAIKNYVSAGVGVSIITDYHIEKSDLKKLCIRDLSKILGFTERALIFKRNLYLTDSLKELIFLLKKFMAR